MPNRSQFHLRVITMGADASAVTLAFFAAYLLRFFSGVVPINDQPSLIEYSRALTVILPVYLWFFRAYGLYNMRRHIRRIEEIFLVLKATTFAVVILMAATFLYRGFSYSRIYLAALWLASVLFVSTVRYLLIQWEYRRKIQKKEMVKLLLIGANRNARNIIQWARANPHYGQEVVGVLARDKALVGKHVQEVAILGVAEQYESFMDHLKPDITILLDPTLTRDQTTDLVAACEARMMEFKLAADFYGLMTRNVDVEYLSSVPLLGFKPLPLDDVWNRAIKRTFDLIATVVVCSLSSPFWILAFLLIKIDDGGPVFYRQKRMGRDQVVFDLLKFRTMKIDAEKETGPVWAKRDDSRRTRVGNFLRGWNIDEFPQLLNVLKGEMSLIGPRPERPHFVTQFRESIPRYMARHKVKAGITGWAQVNGFRGNTSLQQRINYDLHYMENWSLLFDLEILFMTLFAYKNAY